MLVQRNYMDGDYDKIMSFLSEMYQKNLNQHCWLSTRWEYAEYLVNPLFEEKGWPDWKEFIQIWEDGGKIIGIANRESTNDSFVQIRPEYRYLEPEMILWLENNNSVKVVESNKSTIVIWANESDTYRQSILEDRGYIKGKDCSYLNRQELDRYHEVEVLEGYKVRSLAEGISIYERYKVVHKAFHPHKEVMKVPPKSFIKMSQAPLYKPELDIVVEYSDGTLVAAGTVWFSEQDKFGMFEPMATALEHRRKGLGKAILLEGMNRLRSLGAEYAYVESYGEERYDFYNSAGFRAFDRAYPWEKVIT